MTEPTMRGRAREIAIKCAGDIATAYATNPDAQSAPIIEQAILQAVAAERERCCNAIWFIACPNNNYTGAPGYEYYKKAVQAIRASGDAEGGMG